MNQDFCERCRQLFTLQSLQELSGGGSQRYGQVQDVITSARNHCPFCGLIWHLTLFLFGGDQPDYSPIAYDQDDWVQVQVIPGNTSSTSSKLSSLIDCIEIKVEGYDNSHGRCHVFTTKDDPASSLTMGRPVETDVSSPIVVAEAKKLISTCLRTHSECSATITHPQLPARVLDVFGTSTSHVILIKTDNKLGKKKLEYVALSYCWGGDQPIKLLHSNQNILEGEGVSIKSLPKGIQDAVECTKTLGYRFLWVDALCIIQDSEDDKLREISNMASIYRDSAVTIVAAVTGSVFGSFLGFNRASSVDAAFTKLMVKQCRIDLYVDNGEMGSLTIVPRVEGREITRNMPINSRAWCFQESILPRRLLFYGPQELLFRCWMIDCQSVIANVIDYSNGIDPPRPSSYEQRDPDAKRLWYRLVHNYSFRKVSMLQDRVHAISGVISDLREKWTDECIFGVWRSRLLEDLCWTSISDRTERSFHAPSWSWMSLDGPIEANYRDFEGVDARVIKIGEEKTIYMTCRVMTRSQYAHIKPAGVGYDPDLGIDSDEPGGKQVDYLYIGAAKWKDITTSVKRYAILAIAAVEVKEGVFKRVGIVQKNITKSHGVDVWTSLPWRSIALL
ncbi:heterokaryon incompatibility protein-domain-containing protein [Xylariaceae sp. AK1471]|nr:heterokaryon incompatibility protein-domain-containing protein [Xylariaceae sp. AK1471]